MSFDPSQQFTLVAPQFSGQFAPRRPLNQRPVSAEVTKISDQEGTLEVVFGSESGSNWVVDTIIFPMLEARPERNPGFLAATPGVTAETTSPRPSRFIEIASHFQDVAFLSSLRDNYDGEGSPGYAPATIDRALSVSTRIGRYYSELFGEDLPPARLRPGPSGSVDVTWEDKATELSIKVPPSPAVPSVYGESSSTSERIVRRLFGADDEVAVARWLRGQCVQRD